MRSAQPAPIAASGGLPGRQEVVRKDMPESPAPKKFPAAPPPKFMLSGIMYIESGPKAIINGSVVQEGDVISGATVKKIDRVDVVLSYEDLEILLKMNN